MGSVRISQGQLLSIAVNYMSQLLYINASHPLVFERFNVPIFMRYNVSSNTITPGEGSDPSDIRAILANVATTLAQLNVSHAAMSEYLESLESNSRNATPMTGVPSRDSSVEPIVLNHSRPS